MKKQSVLAAAVLATFALTACSNMISSTSMKVKRSLYYNDTGANEPEEFPVLRSSGYAIISQQDGPTNIEKTIQAMRASKLDAYRELSEQVWGVYIKSNTNLADTRQTYNGIYSEVEGVIHGARVIRQYPSGDSYVTELELDTRVLYDMYDMRGTF